MNAKSENLNPDMVADVPNQPTAHALGDAPTAEEVTKVLRSLGNANAVGPDELPVEILNLGLYHEPIVLREFHQVIIRVSCEGKIPQ